METERVERLKQTIEEIRLAVDEKTAAKLELDKWIRLVERVNSFSEECEECQMHFDMLEAQISEINGRKGEITKNDIKAQYKTAGEVSSHLQKRHKLVASGYYMGVYMSLGMSFGLLIGLLFFDNIAIGLPIGMVIGMAIGVGKDNEAKKKGDVI